MVFVFFVYDTQCDVDLLGVYSMECNFCCIQVLQNCPVADCLLLVVFEVIVLGILNLLTCCLLLCSKAVCLLKQVSLIFGLWW